MWILGGLGQYSDSRIKKNIEDIDDEDALNKILALEPKTYNYIDEKIHGTDKVYGFIAQQVREVLPRAVKIKQDYAPNVYKMCHCEADKIYVDVPNEVFENLIKIIDNDGLNIECNIIEIGEGYIIIDKILDVNSIFVYGYKINDLHSMTKDYIFTVNVCATQILSRKIDTQQEEINELKAKVDMLISHLHLIM